MSASGELYESFVISTKLSSTAVKALDGWYARQNIIVKIEIFKEQKNQFYKWQSLVNIKELLPVVAFYMAVSHFHNLEYAGTQKNKNMSLKSMEKMEDFKLNQFKKMKTGPKHEKLLNLWSIIVRLKTEGFSFRKISNYLRSKHRFEVSHTYLAKSWRELEK